MACVYSGILLGHKGYNEMLPFATWMDLGDILLSEISQKEKDKYCVIHQLHVESKKIKQISEYKKNNNDRSRYTCRNH